MLILSGTLIGLCLVACACAAPASSSAPSTGPDHAEGASVSTDRPATTGSLEAAHDAFEAGQLDAANAALDAWMQRHPTDGDAWRLRGHVMMAMERPADARSAFVNALANGCIAPDAVGQLVQLDLQAGRRHAARCGLELLAVLMPENRDAGLLYAQLLDDEGAWHEAVALYRQLIDAYPAWPEPRLALGSRLRQDGDPAAASVQLETAHELGASGANPGDLELTIAECLASAGDYRRALDWYARRPGNTSAREHLRLIELALAAGDTPLAQQHAAAVINAPGAPAELARAHRQLARIAQDSNDATTANAEWELAFAADSSDTAVREYLGLKAARDGDHARAEELLAPLADAAATTPDSRILRALIVSRLQLGHLEAAQRSIGTWLETVGAGPDADGFIRDLVTATSSSGAE
ncbi:MAG: hypothetical protein AB7K09_14125 [Planctomycetota bacterium]